MRLSTIVLSIYGPVFCDRFRVCQGPYDASLIQAWEDWDLGKSSATKIDQKTHHALLARAIIKHGLSFNFVEYEFIRKWVKYLNPDANMKSRSTILSYIR